MMNRRKKRRMEIISHASALVLPSLAHSISPYTPIRSTGR